MQWFNDMHGVDMLMIITSMYSFAELFPWLISSNE